MRAYALCALHARSARAHDGDSLALEMLCLQAIGPVAAVVEVPLEVLPAGRRRPVELGSETLGEGQGVRSGACIQPTLPHGLPTRQKMTCWAVTVVGDSGGPAVTFQSFLASSQEASWTRMLKEQSLRRFSTLSMCKKYSRSLWVGSLARMEEARVRGQPLTP